MTVDEIKQSTTMREVVESYGLKINRAGFCSCPFHGADRHPSMKVYKDSYYCFTCGRSGDVFTFVQGMDGVDFKGSFKALGGSYEYQTDMQRKIQRYHLQKAKEKAEAKAAKLRKKKKDVLADITLQKGIIDSNEPFSDPWTDAINRLEYDFYVFNCLLLEG